MNKKEIKTLLQKAEQDLDKITEAYMQGLTCPESLQNSLRDISMRIRKAQMLMTGGVK